MTIPFSTVANVVAGVLSAAGNAVDLNAVVLTQSIYAPQNQVLDFTDPTDAENWFGAGSIEAQIAAAYFQAPDNASATPGMLKFLGYAENAVAGWLLGASLATMTLTQLQALSGTVSITVAGTLFTSSNINLAAATSFTNAATMIQAGFTTPTFTVTFDNVHSAFLITTDTAGATETITYCGGTVAAALGLDVGSAGTLSQGAAAAVPATQLNWLTANDQNWASFFSTWASQIAEQEAFSAWTNANKPRYVYIPWDEAVADLTPNNPASFGGYLQTNKPVGTLPVYGTALHAALVASWAASLNFGKKNGRSSLCFQSQSGQVASITDNQTYSNVKSNGYNIYGAFGSNNPANNQNWMTPGSISGAWLWADTFFNQIKLNADLQLGIVNGLRTVGQIPYNSDGDAIIEGFCSPAISSALNYGTIRKGVPLSASQIQQIINLVGADVSQTIIAQGYYLFTNAAGTSAEVQQARGSPPAILIYQDGNSIQSITLSSIVIV